MDGIFLLRKEDLPTIIFCDFKEEWNPKFIDDSLFLNLLIAQKMKLCERKY